MQAVSNASSAVRSHAGAAFGSPSQAASQRLALRRCLKVHATNDKQGDVLYQSYNTKKTVFPGEACDELGEEYCGAEGVGEEVRQPEAERKQRPSAASTAAGEDRDYEEYKGEKTVFPGEACDELGGEFCDPPYQEGVFPEKGSKN
eukprot:SM000134S26952  [mRNA]  locus=s134:256489:257690:- [translate_table: standard]